MSSPEGVRVGDRSRVDEHLLDTMVEAATARRTPSRKKQRVCEEDLLVEAEDHQAGEGLEAGMAGDVPEAEVLVVLRLPA